MEPPIMTKKYYHFLVENVIAARISVKRTKKKSLSEVINSKWN